MGLLRDGQPRQAKNGSGHRGTSSACARGGERGDHLSGLSLGRPVVSTWEIAQKSWENHVKNGQTDYEWGFNGKVMEVNG